MIKNKFVAFFLYVILIMLFSNILSYFLHGHVFRFRPVDDLAIPVLVACITGYVFFLRNKTDS